jgi:hypothetical protein
VVGGGLSRRGFFAIGPAVCQALSNRLASRHGEYFGPRAAKLEPQEEEKEEPMDSMLKRQSEFWMGLLSTVSSKTNTPITELSKMDVFDFFALLGVVEKQNQPAKQKPTIPR